MTRADLIEIILGINYDEVDTILDASRERCRNIEINDCVDCKHNECNDSLCPRFWTSPLTEDEWRDIERCFTIIRNNYNQAYHRGYMEGEQHTVKYYNELRERECEESEVKADE